MKSPKKQDTLTIVKNYVLKILNNLQDGERTTAKDIIQKVSSDLKIKISTAGSIVPMIVREWEAAGNGTFRRGQGQGIYKGKRPEKIDPRPRCETCNQVIRTKKGE
jgi:TRAP-type mannitol/chloroaromatic compound transport system substrate-binding protein